MSSSVETYQISPEAAELYESKLVPAIFADWAPHIVEAAGVARGQRVLDVACGTGIVAREVADRFEGTTVVGLDLNEAMLNVARRLRPEIEWRRGDAADLPFEAGAFDTVLCQSALMFFPDRVAALREMGRVAGDGTVAVQVYSSLDAQPAYGPFVDIAAKHAGSRAVEMLSSYWVLGDLDLLASLFEGAGLQIAETRTRVGTVKFDSIDEAVQIEIESSPLRGLISDDVYRDIIEDSRAALGSFQTNGDGVELPIKGHLIAATRR